MMRIGRLRLLGYTVKIWEKRKGRRKVRRK